VVPSLLAYDPEGHALHAVTLLLPSAKYMLCMPLKRPVMHGVHWFGLVPRLQNEPAEQPESWLQSSMCGVGYRVGATVGVIVGGTGVGTRVGAIVGALVGVRVGAGVGGTGVGTGVGAVVGACVTASHCLQPACPPPTQRWPSGAPLLGRESQPQAKPPSRM
jgi:hypothetical protein